jgi:hypothetical protein
MKLLTQLPHTSAEHDTELSTTANLPSSFFTVWHVLICVSFVRSNVLTAVSMKTEFWVVAS